MRRATRRRWRATPALPPGEPRAGPGFMLALAEGGGACLVLPSRRPPDGHGLTWEGRCPAGRRGFKYRCTGTRR